MGLGVPQSRSEGSGDQKKHTLERLLNNKLGRMKKKEA
jgi:hypothetical protein